MSAPGFLREMQENVAKYGRQNTTTLLMVQAIKEIQTADAERDRLKALNAELAEALEMLFGENALQSVCTHDGQDAFGRVKGTWGAKAEAKARAALAKNKGETT